MKKIFIACAHTQGAPLDQLVVEARKIEGALQPLKERKLLEIISNRAANIDDVFNTFTSESDIQVLHYAGHADDQTLYLEEAGNIKGIAELFGLYGGEGQQGKTLRFVFINGCSSKGQVRSLHEAGIEAVIATSRPIDDQAAQVLAEQFYKTWATEGKTLKESFETAKARVNTKEGGEERGISNIYDFDGSGDFREPIPWGLYINPQIEDPANIEGWKLHEPPQLPPMVLTAIKPKVTQSLMEVVKEFRNKDQDARQMMRNEGKDPLMVLIERLPWIIGTHLRRLFAVEEGGSMMEPGVKRLRELIKAYNELTRFISYLTLSMCWDAKSEGLPIRAFPFPVIPEEAAFKSTDFIYRAKIFFQELAGLNNADPLNLKPAISALLQQVEDEQGLRPAYLVMEEWKQAMLEGSHRMDTLVETRAAERPEGVKSLVLEAEVFYAAFLKATLFLTQYKLHTVRSIVVDKLRSLSSDHPYSHYSISLHAAFSQLQVSLTERETATDNYCLLLTPRQQTGDPLANAINLSPFYLDRSSFIGNSNSNYPAVFALDYFRTKDYDKEYVFHYIDLDINHKYQFGEDNELVINTYGAVLPPHIEATFSDTERFERIFEQLQRLEEDFPGSL